MAFTFGNYIHTVTFLCYTVVCFLNVCKIVTVALRYSFRYFVENLEREY